MSVSQDAKPDTVLHRLVQALRSAFVYNKQDQVAPAAVLWPDKDRWWEQLVGRLREELPVLTLGDYAPGERTGPAIWIRCMVDRALPEANWPTGTVPIVYLPGVSKQELRAVEECPPLLRPLAELQYRGTLFTQRNGRDWTVPAFIQSADGGLSIAAATDSATREAFRHALTKLADQTVESLRDAAPITAVFLNALMNPDAIHELLLWMCEPEGRMAAMTREQRSAFAATCKQQFGLDVEKDTPLSAASMLGERNGVWNQVWNRFIQAPGQYPKLPDLLRGAKPAKPKDLLYVRESWPQENEAEETELRAALMALENTTRDEAQARVLALEHAHAERRQWVWCKLGYCPLAQALGHLARLAHATNVPLAGTTADEIADAYATTGWQADASLIDALAAVQDPADVAAVKAASVALYRPWVTAGADAFQRAVLQDPPVSRATDVAADPRPGHCMLFADGLRLDVARRLADWLENKGLKTYLEWRIGPFPGVTDTAKPACSPVAHLLTAGVGWGTAAPDGRGPTSAASLRGEIERAGYQVLPDGATGDPSGAAWTECGLLDSYGHGDQWKLVRRIPEVVDEIGHRVRALLDAGWHDVQVLTDHGWLLLPGGLPKSELPEHLTELRKGRCARLKIQSSWSGPAVPWYWDPDVTVAVAPGIGCFEAGHEYAHGGLSPQECVLPVLTVSRPVAAGQPPSIAEIKWAGFRCRIATTGGFAGLRADLRTKPADASSSLAGGGKDLDADGRASLIVRDDDKAGAAAVVVLIAADGHVMAQTSTIVGDAD